MVGGGVWSVRVNDFLTKNRNLKKIFFGEGMGEGRGQE